MLWRFVLTVAFILGGQFVLGDDLTSVVPSPGAPAGPAFGQPGLAPTQPPSPYASAWPPGGQPAPDPRGNNVGQASWLAPGDRAVGPPVVPAPAACVASPAQSTWYYRLDSFSWNERVGGVDVVNEHGPLSTLGYERRSGVERFRIELFGGTMAYDGSAQITDPNTNQTWDEPYHQSFGTNYLGCRGEYELLIEPAFWSRARFFVGVGTRFWIRDLQNDTLSDGTQVDGYQETWWTFYPYVGLETKDSDEPGLKFFGSARIGATPLTYQYADCCDTTAWPRCGITGQLEAGVRYQRFSLSAFAEIMTWGASAVVGNDDYGYSFQPDSRMMTLGGKLSYTF